MPCKAGPIIAIWTADMISPPSTPNTVKPRMRSSLPTSAFMKPRISESVRVRNTEAMGILKTRYEMTFGLSLVLAQPDPRQFGVREHGEWNLPACGDTVASIEVVSQDAEIVERDVRELRTAGHFSICPNPLSRGFQPLIHLDVAALRQLHAGKLQARVPCVFGARPIATSRWLPCTVLSSPCWR